MCDIYSVKGIFHFAELSYLQCDFGYQSTSTKSQGVSQQEAAGFTQTGVKSALIYECKCRVQQNNIHKIHVNLNENFGASLTKLIVFLSLSHDQHLLRKQMNTGVPPVKRNTLLLSHMNSTLFRIGESDGTRECYLRLQFEDQWSYCLYIKLKALQFQMESVRIIVNSSLMTSG